MQRDLEAMLDGAIGGVAGTATMSAVMLAAGKFGVMGEQPPKRIAEATLEAVGVHHPQDETQVALASFAHVGFGAVTGALFAVLHRRLQLPLSEPLHGMVFATLVWGLTYKGVIPQLGIMPPPERDRPATRPLAMVVAHEVFGATLGAVVSLYPSRRLRR